MRWVSVRFQLGSLFLGVIGSAAALGGAYSHGSIKSVLLWLFVVPYCGAAVGVVAMLYTLRKWKKAARRWRDRQRL
jgi:phosphate/sulfate permease